MPTSLQNAGANLPASDYAPIHVNRMVTGMWSNSNPLRDAATPLYVEKYQGGRQDRIKDGSNTEISAHLTLRRRRGMSVYNSQLFPPIRRYYGWNTFTTTDEFVRVMVDTDAAVYDGTSNSARPNTKQLVFTKSAGAKKTYFLGVGNTLYMTNGVDNVQLSNATGVVTKWGVDAPVTAPTVSQDPRPNPYGLWAPNTGYAYPGQFGPNLPIVDTNNNMQTWDGVVTGGGQGQLGPIQPPTWSSDSLHPATPDGNINWHFSGFAVWQQAAGYLQGSLVTGLANTSTGQQMMTFLNISNQLGPNGPQEPRWNGGIGSFTPDGSRVWLNLGPTIHWSDLGPNCLLSADGTILDTNGYTEQVIAPGKSGPGPAPPGFQQEQGAYTTDGTVTWNNTGPFSVAATAARQYGFAFEASATIDISNMSPASQPIVVIEGNQVTVQGWGTNAPGVDTIWLYRTEQGGAIFYFLASFPNPGPGVQWTYIDSLPDSSLNLEIQAQVLGEGTPLPAGATCLEYHDGRIWAGVGNVVMGSSGPDAVVAGSSGNAGFDLSFTAQSKVTRLWATTLGLIVYTVRDVYIIQPDANTGTLYMRKYIEQMPLLSYDAFCVLLTTPYLFTGYSTVMALDPSAGILEASFPIADKVALIDPASAYCTFMTGPSGETALYLSDGASLWYRFAPTAAPETGFNWSPAANPVGGMSAMQAVEVLPGKMALLVGPAVNGPILQRDVTKNTDNGQAFTCGAEIGSVVLALPGQLAGLAWMTLEAAKGGSAPALGVLLDEVDGPFENVPRTRQDPTNMDPSVSLQSNRHSLIQNQRPAWCRHMQYSISWPAEDAPNELLTSTIFGQMWQEMRTQ